jgi:hypothetical protein
VARREKGVEFEDGAVVPSPERERPSRQARQLDDVAAEDGSPKGRRRRRRRSSSSSRSSSRSRRRRRKGRVFYEYEHPLVE